MAKNDNVEFGKFRKNIMGTLSFEMKLPNMRKSQDFIVYPANEKSNYITIQSDTRFGKIEMTTGRGLMSQSHANGAYAVHLHIDKLVKFELTELQLEKLKEELAKTAGRNVGSAGVVSDNQFADKFAAGGKTEQMHNSMIRDKVKSLEDEISTLNLMLKKLESENTEESYKESQNLRDYKAVLQAKKLNLEDSIKNKGGYMAKGGIYSSDDRWVVTFQNQDSGEMERVTVRANNKKSAIQIAEDESGLSGDWQYYSAEKEMAKGGYMANGGKLKDDNVILPVDVITFKRSGGFKDGNIDETWYDIFIDGYRWQLQKVEKNNKNGYYTINPYWYETDPSFNPKYKESVIEPPVNYSQNLNEIKKSLKKYLKENTIVVGQHDWRGDKFGVKVLPKRGGSLDKARDYDYESVGVKYAKGGELVDKTIDHSGRYLDIVGNHRMLHIHLNDEGREMVMEERENGRGDEEIMYELFEDVAGNSDLMYHTDLGESGFGMTSSSGVTDGYVYGDDGELEPADDTAVVYVDNDSYRRSPIDEMLHTHLVLKNSDFMAKGGKIRSLDDFLMPVTKSFEPKEYDKPRGKTIYDVYDYDDNGDVIVQEYENYNEAMSAYAKSKLRNVYNISWRTNLKTKKAPYVYESGIVLSDGSLAVRSRRGREVNPDGNEVYANGGMTFGGKMHGAGMFADGGIIDEATLEEIEQGFTIRQFREITKKLFPNSFGFAVYKPDMNLDRKGFSAPDYEINGYYGFSDEEIGSELYFPVYKRDHEINFNINQGGENTYFNFNLNDKDGNLWIGTFGFKDRGDVSPEYITSFIAFLMQCYGLPFKVKHTAYAKGGVLSKEENYERRLKFINEDIKRVLENSPEKYLNIPVKDYERMAILLHNIEIASDINDNESDNWTFAKGGSVGTYLPVGKEVSGREINNFIEYVEKFYGKNGLYAEDLGGGFTKKRIKEAVNKYLADLSKGETWGHGDSLDRERVRQYLQPEYSLLAKGGHMGKKTIEKVTLIFDGKEHKYDMVFIDGEFEEVLLPYSMNTPLFDYLEREFDDWMDSASRDYHDMYFSDEAIYTKRGAIKGAIEVIDDTISEDRGKKKVYNLDKGEVDTMSAYS